MKCVFVVLLLLLTTSRCTDDTSASLACENLQLGQYVCHDPVIDEETQQPIGCDKETQTAPVACFPADRVECDGQKFDGETAGFNATVSCKWTDGKSFETALLLSIFLGMFGVDRLYLGYPAIAMVKFCTLGFMFLGQLIDVILIAMQIVKPSDGSYYVIDYYGAKLTKVSMDNETQIF